LFYLAFTEAWERFSFYGMTALLVLYMVNQLLLPGHVEHVADRAVPRRVGVRERAAVHPRWLRQIFGLYAGLVYFTLAGADRRSLDRAAQCRCAGRGLDVGGATRLAIDHRSCSP
jgi:POT family proton-dependent oligopeptide transporter